MSFLIIADAIRNPGDEHWEYVLRAVIDCKKLAAAYLLPTFASRQQAIRPEFRSFLRSGPELTMSRQTAYRIQNLLKIVHRELPPWNWESDEGRIPQNATPIPPFFVLKFLESIDNFRQYLWSERHHAAMPAILNSPGIKQAYAGAYPTAYREQVV